MSFYTFLHILMSDVWEDYDYKCRLVEELAYKKARRKALIEVEDAFLDGRTYRPYFHSFGEAWKMA